MGGYCPSGGVGLALGCACPPRGSCPTHTLVFAATAPVHQLVQTESAREGTVTWRTYHTYIKASGGSVSHHGFLDLLCIEKSLLRLLGSRFMTSPTRTLSVLRPFSNAFNFPLKEKSPV